MMTRSDEGADTGVPARAIRKILTDRFGVKGIFQIIIQELIMTLMTAV